MSDTMYKKIWLLCKGDWEEQHFTIGNCYEGDRKDSDTWAVKNDIGETIVITYSLDIQTYFHHAFFKSVFMNVCGNHPELIDITFEYDTTFRYFFDNSPTCIKHGEKTVDASNEEIAIGKVEKLWPNIHDIKIIGKR